MFGISSDSDKEDIIKTVCEEILQKYSQEEIYLLLKYARSSQYQRNQMLYSYRHLTVESQLLKWFSVFDENEIKMYANYLKPYLKP